MDDGDLVAIAKTMAPFVRECVTDAVGKTLISAELAEQLAAAVRLLHESPPIAERKEPPQSTAPRVTRIERDDEGNLALIYEQSKPHQHD
jgi:hypothetical protein